MKKARLIGLLINQVLEFFWGYTVITSSRPGDIVRIRHRLWRVDAIQEDVLTARTIDGIDEGAHRFYLPLEVIEPAAISNPSTTMLGIPATNRLLMQAYRYSMLHGSAPLLSLQRSCVIPTNYQLVPVVMALNQSERVRLLIADDVGLGKTIEAGLIAAELQSRNLASRILVICPQNLREQWREALQYFFQIKARIISTLHLRVLERGLPPGASPWEYYPVLIASIDYVKSEQIKHHVLAVPWDLVIVDEAHLAAKPHQTGPDHRVSMDRYNFVQELARCTRHLILMTATPHNGYTDTFASLFSMLDCGIVSGPPHDPIINRERAQAHVCQRRRKDVEGWFTEHTEEQNPFPSRNQAEVDVDMAYTEEREVIRAVESYGNNLLALADRDRRVKVQTTARWVVMHLHKRGLSSPFALRRSLANRRIRLNDLLSKEVDEIEATRSSRIITSAISDELARATALDEDIGDELTEEEASEQLDGEIFGTEQALRDELAELDEMIRLAAKVTPKRDSKLRRLTARDGFLDNALAGYFGPKRVIIFTRYRDTLEYLEKEIPRALSSRLSPEQVVTVYGEMHDEQRSEALARFQTLDQGVLIATDCISEGVNLQHIANQIIHYELPWNPNRLEQRNGRVDRYGQREPKVYIRTMVMRDTLDGTILSVLIKKAQQIREDYGFAPPFFGDEMNVIDLVQELGQGFDLPRPQRTLLDFDGGETDLTKEDRPNPFDANTLDQIIQESFYGQTAIDLSEVRTRLRETEETVGTREEFERFVRDGLVQFGCTITENNDLHHTVSIALSDMLLVPGTEAMIERATFDPAVALQDSRAEQLNTGHPVVRRLIELVKQSVFDEGSSTYGRAAALTTPDVTRVTALYHFLVRFTVGTQPATVIEELVPVGCRLHDRSRLTGDELRMLDRARPVPNKRPMEDLLSHLRNALEPSVYEAAFSARVEEQRAGLEADRRALRVRLETVGSSGDWLDGIEKVEMASADLVSVRIYEPAPGVIR